jgi:hypothetical protein
MPSKRRRRPGYRKPFLTVPQILGWADDYHRRLGGWPRSFSGRIRRTDETWLGIDAALRHGTRGLSGDTSLANLLFENRGVRNIKNLPPVNECQILTWARAHFQRTGAWPSLHRGPISGVPGETWFTIDFALRRGTRGLPGGSTLADLLAAAGAKHNFKQQPPLSAQQILKWADAHYRQHGEWPSCASGRAREAPLETWSGLDRTLRLGRRGLPGGSSLPQFLNEHRNLFRGKSRRPKTILESKRLHVGQILAWGRAYRRRTGCWPNRNSGPVAGAPGLKWSTVDSALKAGNRSLPGGLSLAKLFASLRR